jgi:membrane protease YdiL (CAAX protease family)
LIGGGSLLLIVGVFLGPTLSAFIMTGTTEGRAGIRRLLRRFVLWRVGLRWYLFVLIGPPVLAVLGTIVLPGALASFQTPDPLLPDPLLPDPLSVLAYLGLFVLVLVLGGPLGEEPGWRGFALPRLQRLHGPLVGSLILGPLWSFWHLPLNLNPSWSHGAGSSGSAILVILNGLVATVAYTIIFTWVFNNTYGSLLIVILLHTSLDTFIDSLGELFPATSVLGLPIPMLSIGLTLAFVVMALVVVTLTQGRLGYQHYRQEQGPDPATAPT